LAGKSCRHDVDFALVLLAVEHLDVIEPLGFWKVFRENLLAVVVNLHLENVRPLAPPRGEVEPADPAE
jgi:hypothetical protein